MEINRIKKKRFRVQFIWVLPLHFPSALSMYPDQIEILTCQMNNSRPVYTISLYMSVLYIVGIDKIIKVIFCA